MTEHLSSEAQGLFAVLRQSADPEAVAEIERFVAEASDRELCRVNVIDFAARRRLDEERVIAAFLHAARLGIFELFLERALPGLRGRPRHQHNAEIGQARGLYLRSLRRRLRAEPRRDGRGDVYAQPPGPPDRRA